MNPATISSDGFIAMNLVGNGPTMYLWYGAC